MAHDDGFLPQIRQLQGQFLELHKEVDAMREATRDPKSIKSAISALEDEKQQLERRIDVSKNKACARARKRAGASPNSSF